MDPIRLIFPKEEEDFYPLSLTRSILDLKVGVFTLREKWERLASLQSHSITFDHENGSQHKVEFESFWIPSAATQFDLLHQLDPEANGCSKFNRPWDIFPILIRSLKEDIEILSTEIPRKEIPSNIQTTGDHDIFLHENCHLEPCMINSNDGPVIIDDGALVMQGAMLRGPVYIGKNTTVKMGSMLYAGSSIGDSCIVGGEVKNSIIHAYTNKAHHGYIGDSYIGEFCNVGAGTSCSNLKNTAGKIKAWNMHSGQFEEAADKLGIIMGDHVRTAINTGFNSGTVIGPFSNIFNLNGLSPKYISPFTWGGGVDEKYKLENVIKDVHRWQGMKELPNSQLTTELIKNLYSKFQ